MYSAVSDDVEVFAEAGLFDHGGGVAAHQHRLTGGEDVVVVQDKRVGGLRDGTFVDGDLAVIFATVFEGIQLEYADRPGGKVSPCRSCAQFQDRQFRWGLRKPRGSPGNQRSA